MSKAEASLLAGSDQLTCSFSPLGGQIPAVPTAPQSHLGWLLTHLPLAGGQGQIPRHCILAAGPHMRQPCRYHE